MPLEPVRDDYGIPGDIPRTRDTLLQVTSKFNIYFMLAMGLAGGAVCMVGLFEMSRDSEAGALLDQVPAPIMLTVIGMIAFSLFFPFFMALYFGRHFLRSLLKLEDEVARLRKEIDRRAGPAVDQIRDDASQ